MPDAAIIGAKARAALQVGRRAARDPDRAEALPKKELGR
jgi:hypothetical protein